MMVASAVLPQDGGRRCCSGWGCLWAGTFLPCSYLGLSLQIPFNKAAALEAPSFTHLPECSQEVGDAPAEAALVAGSAPTERSRTPGWGPAKGTGRNRAEWEHVWAALPSPSRHRRQAPAASCMLGLREDGLSLGTAGQQWWRGRSQPSARRWGFLSSAAVKNLPPCSQGFPFLPPGPCAVLPAACSLLWILLLPWLWVEKGSWSGSLENRITVKRGRFLQVTCELLPPIPRPGLPGRNFKLLPSSALATGSGSMTARGIFLLGLLALWAELQAAPTAGKYGHAGNTRPL